MDPKTLAKLVWRRATDKQAKGEIPTFLGVEGMLALMHRDITNFYKATTEESKSNYVLDLCVDALFALQCVIPDILSEEISEDEEDKEVSEDVGEGSGEETPRVDGEDTDTSERDSRFTSLPPGKSIQDL